MNRSTWFLYLFLIDALIELCAPIFLPELRFLTKPLLMILLALYAWQEKRTNLLPILLFAWLGDVFLLIPSENPLFFQLGLGSFLLMQIGYIRLFVLKSHTLWHLSLLLVCLYVFAFLAFLYPYLSAFLRIPVALYALALGAMLYFAGRTGNKQLLLGAVLFVLSDSLLAVGKFYGTFPGNSFLVMSTYMVAQLLLIQALCKLETRL